MLDIFTISTLDTKLVDALISTGDIYQSDCETNTDSDVESCKDVDAGSFECDEEIKNKYAFLASFKKRRVTNKKSKGKVHIMKESYQPE